MKDCISCSVNGCLIGMMVGLFIGGFFGSEGKERHWKKESVKMGHAEYVLKGDKAVWQWKDDNARE